MRNRVTLALGFLVLVVYASAQQELVPRSKTASQLTEDFRKSLDRLADFSPDPCGPPYGKESDWHSQTVESPIFESASEVITQALNASTTGLSPRDTTVNALRKLERISEEVNSSWPEENRFHFEILGELPLLVVKMGVRTHEEFFAFAVSPQKPGKSNHVWRNVGWGNGSPERDVPQLWLNLYPLHRGPSGNPRFLAKFTISGCAGSIGVTYDAREWQPQAADYLEQIIEQTGSFGLDDKDPGFERIGKLETTRPTISLPYCWFSAIDTWDNPSLCAVDSYDVSGNKVRFSSRVYNRPDLVPVAKAIEYAERHDYPAVLGYCASAETARKLVRDLPPDVGADDLRVTKIGKGKELVELAPAYRFEVEERNGSWVVVSFRVE